MSVSGFLRSPAGSSYAPPRLQPQSCGTPASGTPSHHFQAVPRYLEGPGIVRVLLRSGSGLYGIDHGSADPRVTLSLGKCKEQHSTTKHKTVDPDWHESFDFEADRLLDLLESELKLTATHHSMWNKVFNSSDLGHASLSLRRLLSSCPVELPHAHADAQQALRGLSEEHERVALHYPNGAGQGHLSLQVRIIPGALRHGEKDLADASKRLAAIVELDQRSSAPRRTIAFSGAGEEMARVEDAWVVDLQQGVNAEVLTRVARLLQSYPRLTCRVHAEVEAVARAPQRLADHLSRHRTDDAEAIMDFLASKRAQAVLDALVSEGGVPSHQLYTTATGRGAFTAVTFHLQLEPKPAYTPSEPEASERGGEAMAAGRAHELASRRVEYAATVGGATLGVRAGEIGVKVGVLTLSDAVLREPHIHQVRCMRRARLRACTQHPVQACRSWWWWW